MIPDIQRIIAKSINPPKKQPDGLSESSYNLAKDQYRLKVSLIHLLKDSFLILIGIIAAGFGLEGFLLPNSFIDGGVTGISLLTRELTEYPLPILIILINTPFVI